MPPLKLLKLLKFDNNKSRFIFLSVVFIVFILLFLFFHSNVDYIINMYFGIPVLLATFYYGFFTGLISMFFLIAVHISILHFAGLDFAFIYENKRIIIAFISLIVIMYIISLVRVIKNTLLKSEERYKLLSGELQKLNSTKDKFFAIIGHDLRSPISSICTNIDMLIDSNNDFNQKEKNDILKSVQKVTSQVLRLLENLLEWTAVQKPDMRINPVNLNLFELCENCVSLYHTQAVDKEIKLDNQIDKKLVIKTDKNCLETIIRNLLSNSIKFTYKGGLVSLEALEEQNSVKIIVKDNGKGMSPELVGKLFDINADVVNSGTFGESGTGLGLLLCNELIRKCNGRISVESHLLIGTSFNIELPKDGFTL